ncbi:MAG: radical SAM protein [Nanoarchaeota archaeon]|nr:radical SAM protein [Nanoarchaeota archaeon]
MACHYYPKTVFVDITSRCNLKCKHCIKEAGPENQVEMPFEKVVSIFNEIKCMDAEKVVISGGEPMVHKDFFRILEYASRIFKIVYIDTNGTMITQKSITRIKPYTNCRFQISLDGSSPNSHDALRGKGSFNRTLKGVRMLIKSGIIPIIATTVNRYNCKKLNDMHRLVEKLGIRLWRIMALMRQGRAIKHNNLSISLKEWNNVANTLQKIKGQVIIDIAPMFTFIGRHMPDMSCEQAEGLGCEAGKFRANILPNGDLIPCSMLPQFIAGNVFTSDLKKIWLNSKTLEEFRVFDYNKVKECKSCEYSKYCKGGCHGMAAEYFGTIYRKDPRCPK